MRRFGKFVVPVLCLGTLVTPLAGVRGKKADREFSSPVRSSSQPQVRLLPAGGRAAVARADAPAMPTASVPGDSFTLAEFTFDGYASGPDPQGWITVDISSRPDTFFHVDDFAGLSGGYAPLEGAQSLWCGARPDPIRFPNYATLPGYGNSWPQRFESVPFASSGDVTVSFLIRYDSEPGYDHTFLEYLDNSGDWQTAASFDGQGDSVVTVVIPAADLLGTAELRFHFQSDGAWSDQDGLFPSDGAVIIDSLTVADTTGVLDFQDFESESPGALFTADGDWTSNPTFGDYGGLFDGTTVLQEDTVVTNTSHLWGFFNGSPDNYACGGFPAQPAVPFTTNPGSKERTDYLHNEIWSPLIQLGEDVGGFPVPATGSVTLELDVYRDLPLSNVVFFQWRVRSVVDGYLREWRNDSFVYYGAEKQWQRATFELFPFIDPGATHIQVAVGAVDLCYQFCGVFGTGSCHSHAPLFDNVTIRARESADIVVTNTADAGSGSLRQAILSANGSADRSRIVFDIPGPGPHTISPLTPLQMIQWPVVIDATTQPDYTSAPIVSISGVSAGASTGLRLNTNQSVIAGLAIHGFSSTGIIVMGDNDTIRGNYIGVTTAQIPDANGGHGVSIFNNAYLVANTVVGGTQDQHANIIAYNNGDGVSLFSGEGHRNVIRGNSIHSNAGLGIDIHNDGITANDAQDTDAGTNKKQNYPVLGRVFAGVNVIEGSLNSSPNSDFVIDFYSNTVCDPVSFGEGERFLGSVAVATDPSGNVAFNTVVAGTLSVGEHVTATATDASGNTSEFSRCVTVLSDPTGVPEDPILPDRLALFQNAPNPFNPTTAIRYDVPAGGANVQIIVYDVLGRHVRTLVNGFETAGRKRVTWDGGDARGQAVATGVYFVRMHAGTFVQTRKMVQLK